MRYRTDSEGDICGNTKVIYKGQEYTTGNRYHDLVELWDRGKLQIVVKILKNHTFRRLG